MRGLEFAKRNFKELYRDYLSLIFCLIFPIILFVVLQAIMKSIGVDMSHTPQFLIDNFTSGMIVFSFSFLSVFVGNTIALDRESSFMLRLKTTPMKPVDFILGYTLAYLPVAVAQEILIIVCGLIFGLEISIGIILMVLVMFPMALLFIGFGILFGLLVSSKGVGGLASMLPTFTGLLGGIFFPLDLIDGGFANVCYSLPFANMIKVGRCFISNGYSDLLIPLIISFGYVVVVYVSSIFLLKYRLSSDRI